MNRIECRRWAGKCRKHPPGTRHRGHTRCQQHGATHTCSTTDDADIAKATLVRSMWPRDKHIREQLRRDQARQWCAKRVNIQPKCVHQHLTRVIASGAGVQPGFVGNEGQGGICLHRDAPAD